MPAVAVAPGPGGGLGESGGQFGRLFRWSITCIITFCVGFIWLPLAPMAHT